MEKQSKTRKIIHEVDTITKLLRKEFKGILSGKFLLKDFFKRQMRVIGLIIFLTVMYIDNGFHCEKQLAKVTQLQEDLLDAKHLKLNISSELTKLSRRSSVLEQLELYGLDLEENRDLPILID